MKQKLKCFLITIFLIVVYSIHSHASDLKWDTPTGDVSGYTIYYGLSQGSYPFSEDVGNVTQYSLNNFSLSEGTTYYFIVRAYNTSGESGDSNVTTYAVPSAGDTTPPLAPAGISGEIVSEDILLTWESNSEADISVYRVYYGTSTRNYGLPIPVEGTEYSISGLEPDVLYYFAVTAVDTSGNESGYSSPEIIKTISISKDIEGSMLTWVAATGDVSGYKIYFGTSEGNYTEDIDVGEVTQYSLNNFSLTIGITYYFVVRAYNDYGESENSNVATYAIGELEDTASPVVTITSPTTEISYGTKSASMDIGGTASDVIGVTQVIWSNSRGGLGTATGTDNWSVAGIPLVQGENVITVTASDDAGNTSADILTIESVIPDTTAPVVTISEPTADTIFNTFQASINISGTASDDIGVTQIEWWSSAGAGGTAAGTSNWDVDTIYLIEGENVITITARDEAGNESTDTLTVVYTIPDTTAQLIISGLDPSDYEFDVLTTGNTAWIDRGYQLTEIPEAYSGLSFIRTAIRDSRNTSNEFLSFTSNKAIRVYVCFDENSGSIPVWLSSQFNNTGDEILHYYGTLSIWEKEFSAGVISLGGNEVGGYTYIVACEITTQDESDTTAPAVAITSPTAGTTYSTQSGSLNIGGTASDAIGVTQVAWSNSRGGSGTATGTTSWSAAGIPLAVGENVITVTVRDEAGNASTDILTVAYTIPDTTAPAVAFSSPTTGITYSTQSDSLNIGGTASDAIGVTQVAWSNSRGGSGTATGTTSWSVAGIALAEGNNVITVTVSDEAGNTSTDVLTVVYTIPVVTDTQAPVLQVNEPTTGGFFFTRQANIKISGTASDNSSLKMIKWSIRQSGNGVASGTSSWEAVNVRLAKYWNNITITAEDEAGNITAYDFTVFSWQ
jgi:hypothetical protein